ncbi:hypothetical protein H112_03144 [Trichophyton rubrum D6]|nr:hypothetical protein H112_03144 [Trichophyton rubrum D6]
MAKGHQAVDETGKPRRVSHLFTLHIVHAVLHRKKQARAKQHIRLKTRRGQGARSSMIPGCLRNQPASCKDQASQPEGRTASPGDHVCQVKPGCPHHYIVIEPSPVFLSEREDDGELLPLFGVSSDLDGLQRGSQDCTA